MRIVLTTVPSDKIRKIKKEILEEKIAACCLVIPIKESKFWWKDKLETEEEDLLLFKTQGKLVNKLFKRIKELHPYDVPFIAEIEVEKIYEKYEEWLNEVTGG